MKKFVLVAIMAVAGISLAVAQPRAIGGRLGYGVEVSYQHGFGETNMLQLEVGVPGFNSLEAACTYDWINPGGLDFPTVEYGDLNWFAGVGGQIMTTFAFNWGYVGPAGRIGFEYNFPFPLQLSLDWRPSFGVAFNGAGASFWGDLYYGGLGIGVRYLF